MYVLCIMGKLIRIGNVTIWGLKSEIGTRYGGPEN